MKTLYVFRQILVLFLIMGVGYYSAKVKILDDNATSCISNFIVSITLPLMILTSFNIQYSRQIFLTIIKILVFSIATFIFSMGLGKLISFKFGYGKRNILMFAGMFSNCGFIGFPILKIIYGSKGVLYTSIFNLAYNVFVWTIGVLILDKSKGNLNYKTIFFNPNIMAVAFGMLFMFLYIKIPYTINSACNLVGSMTAPLSMVVIGSILTEIQFRDIFKDWSLYYISIFRLIIIPFIIYCVLKLIKVDDFVIGVIVICEAMPAATLCPILAKSYNENFKYASKIVFVTTVLSIITIPAAIVLLKI
ncbi:AEC family transporter [Clostridium guangxiense]|uniref:AEC family transporter n=1 Tax=Clostridium guangxiense TaxID=1662055 RepID=UPI001E2C6853|nr:AEC family transporter [Clostridium guangxiense]MCD2347937.1 AEC family transporter [Clostridium guangxiense]